MNDCVNGRGLVFETKSAVGGEKASPDSIMPVATSRAEINNFILRLVREVVTPFKT
jgi:hypothetical protein